MTTHVELHVEQERDVVRKRPIVTVGILSVVVTIVAIAVSALLLRGQADALRIPRAVARPSVAPRQIGLVDQTLIDREDYGAATREAQRRELERYGWVDRDAGIAAIPIERAMEIVAAGKEGTR